MNVETIQQDVKKAISVYSTVIMEINWLNQSILIKIGIYKTISNPFRSKICIILSVINTVWKSMNNPAKRMWNVWLNSVIIRYAVIESNQERVVVFMMIVNSITANKEYAKVQLCISYRRKMIMNLSHQMHNLIHQIK